MYKITKEFSFSASHQLRGLSLKHPCSRLHGHNYVIKVELSSEELDEVGFVTDYRDLSYVKEWIDEHLDHKHLNDVFPKMNPTAEHLAQYLFRVFKPDLPQLIAIEVSETPKTNCRYEE